MQLSPKQAVIILGGIVVVALVVLLIVGGARPPKPPSVTLTVWGIFDDSSAFEKIAEGYKELRPNVEVRYERLDERTYRATLINALAAGRGPDVFVIHNRSLPRDRDKLVPVGPEEMGLARLRELFPTVVEQDFTYGGYVFALPLYLDTLVLIYNRDIFDSAGVVSPPKTWDDFQAVVPRLRALTPSGQILKAAAAIGGSDRTVNAGVDLLHLLMLQNGTVMVSPDLSYATFATGGSGGSFGLRAFNFYLQFANAASPLYTWNEEQSPALDSFAAGRVAMIFGYHSDVAALKKKNPFLNFGVAPLPQPKGGELTLSYADYWGLTVSKQSPAASWAWDFVIYAAADPQSGKSYFESGGRPPALRSLVSEKISDPELGVFARQALTARSWYEADEGKIDEIFNSAISAVLSGKRDSSKALQEAQDQVSQLMRR